MLAIWLAIAPEHGTLTVRRAMLKATNLKQCLATEVPAFVAFYRGAAGELFSRQKQTQHFHVSISNAANNVERI